MKKSTAKRWLVFSTFLCVFQGCKSTPGAGSADGRPRDSAAATAPPTPAAATPVAPTLRSPRILKLLEKAKSVSRGPISIFPMPYGAGERQAYNTQLGGNEGFEIHAMEAPSSDYADYNDALLAHELGHVILISKGFPNGAYRVLKSEGLESDRALNVIARQIGPDCFPDELIDRESVKQGFHPELLVQRQMELTEQGLAAFEIGEMETSSHLSKEFEALKLFCIGKRIPAQSLRDFEGRVEVKYGPTIMARERTLSKQFRGKWCRLGDPSGCFELVLKLRDASKLHGYIAFRNPSTGRAE